MCLLIVSHFSPQQFAFFRQLMLIILFSPTLSIALPSISTSKQGKQIKQSGYMDSMLFQLRMMCFSEGKLMCCMLWRMALQALEPSSLPWYLSQASKQPIPSSLHNGLACPSAATAHFLCVLLHTQGDVGFPQQFFLLVLVEGGLAMQEGKILFFLRHHDIILFTIIMQMKATTYYFPSPAQHDNPQPNKSDLHEEELSSRQQREKYLTASPQEQAVRKYGKIIIILLLLLALSCLLLPPESSQTASFTENPIPDFSVTTFAGLSADVSPNVRDSHESTLREKERLTLQLPDPPTQQQHLDPLTAQLQTQQAAHKKEQTTSTQKSDGKEKRNEFLEREKELWEVEIFAYMNTKFPIKAKDVEESKFLQIRTKEGSLYETLYFQPDVYNYYLPEAHEEPTLLEIQNVEAVEKEVERMKSAGKLEWEANFAYELYKQPESTLLKQAQYYHYDKLYNIGGYEEKPICLIAAGRNLMRNNDYLEFFQSVARQNYTNFHVVLGDDSSDDCTFNVLDAVISLIPRLKERSTLIRHKHSIGALGNKDVMIRNYCNEGEIVVDMDADDSLIGAQVFKIINALYHRTDNWFIYSNFLFMHQKLKRGYSQKIPDENWERNDYRSSKLWVTTHLRTYVRELYMSIPVQHFFQYPGYYYLWASDRFIMYAVTELAGKQKTQYLPLFLYYYNRTGANRTKCDWIPMEYDEWKARIQIPFKPLKSLYDQTTPMNTYEMKEETLQTYKQKKQKYQTCAVGKS